MIEARNDYIWVELIKEGEGIIITPDSIKDHKAIPHVRFIGEDVTKVKVGDRIAVIPELKVANVSWANKVYFVLPERAVLGVFIGGEEDDIEAEDANVN